GPDGAPTSGPGELAGRGEHRVRVAGHADVPPDPLDHAVGVEEEGGPHDAHVRATVVALLGPYAPRLQDRAFLVREQREPEPVRIAEVRLASGRIRGDADYRDAQGLELLAQVAEGAGLLG